MNNIRTLDIHPAWGFQTYDRLAVALDQRDKKVDDGCHRNTCVFYQGWNNGYRLLTYVPLLNVICGLFRIAVCLRDSTENAEKQAINKRHIVRGCLDIPLGPLLLPFDLFQTYLDNQAAREYIADFENQNNGRRPHVGPHQNNIKNP